MKYCWGSAQEASWEGDWLVDSSSGHSPLLAGPGLVLRVAAGSSGGLRKLGWTEPHPWEAEASGGLQLWANGSGV